jgi:hypothetical protein
MLGRRKEELSPIAKEYKKTYERWFYGVLAGFVSARVFREIFLPLSIVELAFSVYCLYESQTNYSLYKAARNEGAAKA